MYYAVIMAGGAGTRLWPAAREARPKQLHRLIFERPLIAETVARLAPTYPLEHILIVTAARYAGAIRDVVPDLPPRNIISEPFGRNTAAAIALAAFRIAAEDPDGVFAVFPADHVILKPEVLFRALDAAGALALEHRVVDIGVPPSHPETGYGYIELGEQITERDGVEAFAVRRFVEKPDRQTAEGYLAAGNYLWNSGMFVWGVASYLEALREYLPETHDLLASAAGAGSHALAAAYERIPNISVDYAIMEKISDVVAVPADFGWRDIGDWAALYDMLDHDMDGNAFDGEHVALDTSGSLVVAPGKLVATVGVSDLIVVEDGDVLLIMRRDRAQDVKKVLDQLKETNRERYL
jgi:mannose-1-phosphate guanylyltransferase